MKLIEYGRIVKAHGLRGEVILLPHSRNSDNLQFFSSLLLGQDASSEPQSELKSFEILEQKNLGERSIVLLKGINSREDAARLVGSYVYVDSELLAEPEEDEYYWYQLIGLEVFDEKENKLGTVSNLQDNASQNLLVIKNGGREHLVPFIDHFIKSIDLDNNKIVLALPGGFID